MEASIPILDQCSLSRTQENTITVEALSSYLSRNKNLVFPHRHSFYQLLLFTQGAGTHAIDFETFNVVPWQIYMMLPGQIHRWDFEGEMDGFIVNFQPDFFHTFLLRPEYLSQFSFFSGLIKDQVFDISPDLQNEVMRLFRELLATRDLDFAKITLLYLFKTLERSPVLQNKSESAAYNHTLLRNFMSLIESNYRTLRLPKDYAKLLFITPNHLNALVKESMGLSAGELIRNRVLLEAKRLLVIQDYSISEIAYGLNFNDNSYFTKFFKKNEGITPEEFRKKHI
ncbi:helix-turn-helix domain-containing protein [Sphingobacterium spiritivorum]|uniref:helix-turn-helix domain-containing protein n=1 Tax=Sphingobacterium spiritivorum TaxID=258 RepID=UPI003DA3D5CC